MKAALSRLLVHCRVGIVRLPDGRVRIVLPTFDRHWPRRRPGSERAWPRWTISHVGSHSHAPVASADVVAVVGAV